MKIHHFVIALNFSLIALTTFGQKKILGPEVYNDWKKIGNTTVSSDGKYAAYTIKPHHGDGYLYLVDIASGKKDSVARGVDPEFSRNSGYLIFQVTPEFDTLRSLELKKVDKDKWPKNVLVVWNLATDSISRYEDLKEYKLAENGLTLAYLTNKDSWPKMYLSKKEQKAETKLEKKHGKVKSGGKLLTILNLENGDKVCYRHVSAFDLSPSGQYVLIQEQEKAKKDSLRLIIHKLDGGRKAQWRASQRVHALSNMVFNDDETRFVMMQSNDTNAQKAWNLVEFSLADQQIKVLIDSSSRFSEDLALSAYFKPYYKNGNRHLFFGVGTQPVPDMKDTLLESEKVKLDLWHWKDARLQPQQLHELRRDERKSYACILNLENGQVTQLAQDTLSVDLNRQKGESQTKFLATSDERYKFKTWESPSGEDYYLLDLEGGEPQLLQERAFAHGYLAPSGDHFIFWNEKTKNYYAMETETQQEWCVTCDYSGNILEDLNGMPMMDQPMGVAGFSPKSAGAIIRAEKDLLYFDLATHQLTSLTSSLKTGTPALDTIFRYALINLADSTCFYPGNCVLTRFNKLTKAMDVYRVSGNFPQVSYELIAASNHNYMGFKKAAHTDRVIFNRASNRDYPDLYATTTAGEAIRRLSETNPQQADYNWSTVELIKWNSYEGIPLEGLLYKPENFDTNQTYPLLVYYYEMYSDDIHNHYAPRPTASIISPTEYASAGYVVLIPDIRYKPGHPAEGAYDCIMSGTDAVLNRYSNIDPKRMGLQGQSWGGYQTAQLVTMTDRYTAAMAGAPVGNMFSAYGGIRWGSGYSRQFQYEHTQSRIGGTIWEVPELYVENSPVFHLTDVKTPLMIMHNDGDGAVPWYQGIELYTGLRRLQKPVWLLNYNGDDHNLMKNANRMDLSIRMRQFFDYYLLGKPAPLWLLNGIPAIDKGKKLNYELGE